MQPFSENFWENCMTFVKILNRGSVWSQFFRMVLADNFLEVVCPLTTSYNLELLGGAKLEWTRAAPLNRYLEELYVLPGVYRVQCSITTCCVGFFQWCILTCCLHLQEDWICFRWTAAPHLHGANAAFNWSKLPPVRWNQMFLQNTGTNILRGVETQNIMWVEEAAQRDINVQAY